MATVPPLPPRDEIFRFVHVRAPRAVNRPLAKYGFVKTLDPMPSSTGTFYKQLLDILADESKYNLLKDELQVFQNNSREHNNKLFKRILKA
jgi:hypothetical protein